jgi:hypothetical protein
LVLRLDSFSPGRYIDYICRLIDGIDPKILFLGDDNGLYSQYFYFLFTATVSYADFV